MSKKYLTLLLLPYISLAATTVNQDVTVKTNPLLVGTDTGNVIISVFSKADALITVKNKVGIEWVTLQKQGKLKYFGRSNKMPWPMYKVYDTVAKQATILLIQDAGQGRSLTIEVNVPTAEPTTALYDKMEKTLMQNYNNWVCALEQESIQSMFGTLNEIKTKNNK